MKIKNPFRVRVRRFTREYCLTKQNFYCHSTSPKVFVTVIYLRFLFWTKYHKVYSLKYKREAVETYSKAFGRHTKGYCWKWNFKDYPEAIGRFVITNKMKLFYADNFCYIPHLKKYFKL